MHEVFYIDFYLFFYSAVKNQKLRELKCLRKPASAVFLSFLNMLF